MWWCNSRKWYSDIPWRLTTFYWLGFIHAMLFRWQLATKWRVSIWFAGPETAVNSHLWFTARRYQSTRYHNTHYDLKASYPFQQMYVRPCGCYGRKPKLGYLRTMILKYHAQAAQLHPQKCCHTAFEGLTEILWECFVNFVNSTIKIIILSSTRVLIEVEPRLSSSRWHNLSNIFCHARRSALITE